MSKSLGNVVTIRKVAETHDLEALRLLFVSVHYRSPVDLHHRARGERPGHAYPIWTRPRRGWTTSTGRWNGWTRRPGRRRTTAAPVAPPCRQDASGVPGSDGRRLQHRGGDRPPVRRASCSSNKLLDEPKAMPKDVAPADAGRACGATCARAARRWASCSGRPSEFLLARRGAAVCPQGDRPGGGRGAHRRPGRRAGGADFARADEIRRELQGAGHRADGQRRRHHLAGRRLGPRSRLEG